MFDKKRCLDNIYALAKEKGLKIGDIEEKAGVSKGYLSRINKEDNATIPGIDLLASIADQLHVGIDYLVDYTHGSLTSNEKFVFQFIDRLSKRTAEGKLEWIVEDAYVLTSPKCKNVENPLVDASVEYNPEFDREISTHGYTSLIYSGQTEIAGDCYHCSDFVRETTVYLNAVKYKLDKDDSEDKWSERVIEVYVYQGSVRPVCSTYYLRNELKEAVEKFFATVSSAHTHIGLDQSTKDIMTAILDDFDNFDVSPF